MIPNLNDLPPLLEEERPLKKLAKPLFGLLFMLAITTGLAWLYTVGLKQSADQEMNINNALTGIAEDLWTTGTAPEIRVMDPKLPDEILRLRRVAGPGLQLRVLPAEGLAGANRGTHELLYLRGTRQVLSIRIFLDEAEGKVDVLSFLPGSGFEAKPLP